MLKALPPLDHKLPFAKYTVLARTKTNGVLCLRTLCDKKHVSLELHEPWAQLDITPGNTIHIIETFNNTFPESSSFPTIVDAQAHFVIVEPDILVSGTTAASLHECLRKGSLSSRHSSDSGLAAVIGKCAHLVIQHFLIQKNASQAEVSQVIDEVIAKHAVDLWVLNQSTSSVKALLLGEFNQFWNSFFTKFSTSLTKKRKLDVSDLDIVQVIDIEENYWSPTFGLKGKIDASLQVTVHNTQESGIVPLEIKTGREWITTHSAQTMLYSLLMADTYSDRLDIGLLYYVSTCRTIPVHHDHNALRDILLLRNKHVIQLRKNTLPGLIRQQHVCQRCYYNKQCLVYHKAKGGTHVSANLDANFFNNITQHITPHHATFFEKWINAIDQEVQSTEDKLSDLKFKLTRKVDFTFEAIFTGADGTKTFEHRDYVAISHENGPVGIATGFIGQCTQNSISVILERPFRPRWTRGNERFSIQSIKSETSNNTMRSNLVKLLLNVNCRARDLIVDLEVPRFENGFEFECNLNDHQKAAIEKIIRAKDYCLVEGMPGTGKSTMLAYLIKILADKNQRVLLTSHTHSAVDNVLNKLKNHGEFRIIRIGPIDKVECKEYCLNPSTIEQVNFVSDCQVVAVTCMGASNVLLGKLEFDVCIIDEASQVLFPAAIAPLLDVKKFVLVGDRLQLTPIAKSEVMKMSLFEYLLIKHPHASCQMAVQYRMNADIMALNNILAYGGRLLSASDVVANQKINMDEWIGTGGVSFVDICSEETGRWINEGQIEMIRQIIGTLLNVVVLSPYRQQVARMQEILAVECSTIDRYQGRDKDIVIVSLVRCNDKGIVGDLLRDWRRINVAFTRAKGKLIIVGSASTMSHSKMWASLLDCLPHVRD